MTALAEPGGLIGAFKRAGDRISAGISNHDAWAIRLVFFAGIITIFHKAGVGSLKLSELPPYNVAFAVALGVAALLYEMNATTYALRNFWNGKAFSAFGWAFVWLCAFGYSMNQWVGAASESEGGKSNVHKAAFVASQNADDAVKSAKKELDRVQGRLAWMDTAVNGKPVRNIEAVDADITNAMADKLYKASNSCMERSGKKQATFCEALGALKAEKALASELATIKDELPAAQKDYKDALAAKGNTKTEMNEARNDLVILTKYVGLKEDDARTLNALGSIIAISIFLSVATMLRELEHLRNTTPRKPIFRLGAALTAFRNWLWEILTGKPLTKVERTTIIRDARTVAEMGA